MLHGFRNSNTFTVHVTACDLKKSFSIDVNWATCQFGRLTFLSPNKQRQNTKGKHTVYSQCTLFTFTSGIFWKIGRHCGEGGDGISSTND